MAALTLQGMGQPSIYHATVSLSFQIEICNLDRTISSFLATSLYKKVIFTKNVSYKVLSPQRRYATIKNFIFIHLWITCPIFTYYHGLKYMKIFSPLIWQYLYNKCIMINLMIVGCKSTNLLKYNKYKLYSIQFHSSKANTHIIHCSHTNTHTVTHTLGIHLTRAMLCN